MLEQEKTPLGNALERHFLPFSISDYIAYLGNEWFELYTGYEPIFTNKNRSEIRTFTEGDECIIKISSHNQFNQEVLRILSWHKNN